MAQQPIEFDSRGDGTMGAFPEGPPPIKVRQLLLSEVLTKAHKAKTKQEKVRILREEDCSALRQICKWSYDPKIESELPSGTPPFVPNEAPEGTEHMLLRTEGDKLWHFVKNNGTSADPNLQATVRERMFIRLLEGLHKDEAELLCAVKDKTLHQVYKGVSTAVVSEAFDWDENFRKKDV